MTLKTDEQLLSELCSGNTEIILSIYERYKQPLYSFALRIVRNEQAAEDAVHETIVKLMTRCNDITNTHALKSWMFSVTRNECLSYVKKCSKHSEVLEDSLWEDGEIEVETGERATIVKKMIEKLKIEYREVVLLREFEQLSYEAIAEITRTPVSTVKSRLFKARQELIKKLKPYFLEN
jgi:RNA polymerase sigma-70 factor, ECF subfamily